MYLLLLPILFSCSVKPTEERFVNPLFYEAMISYPDRWITKITPTGLTESHLGDSYFFPCYLLKNTNDTVVLNCETMSIGFQSTNPNLRAISKYVLKPQTNPDYRTVEHFYFLERDLKDSYPELLEIDLNNPKFFYKQ